MEQSPEASTHNDDDAVTVSISRRPRPGREREFEAFLRGVTEAASRFPGHLSFRVIRPSRGDRHYRVVIRFDRASHLRAWEESDERRAWLARGAEVAEDEPLITNLTGTAQARPLALALTPVETFVRTSVSGIGLLLVGTLLAIVLANSPLASAYTRFWETELTIGVEGFGITESLRHWVNDGLMALFFFIVGLEIKREILVGEMRHPRQAAFPIAAALGGALASALVYAGFTLTGDGLRGWGIPMATDTAFSLGILTLLGSRVPPLLVIFLTAFAIVDDILAVMVIAIFYTASISWPALGIAAALLAVLAIANAAGFHRWPAYAFLGLGVWVAVFESGVHATIAGVLVALTVPARSWINPSEFVLRGRQLIDDFERACDIGPSTLSNQPQQQASQALERLAEEVETPMTHLQHQLNPWVAFAILPLFAFANAGIPLTSGLGEALSSSVTWGVVAGLVAGKPLGITLGAWLAVRTGVAILPTAISWRQVLGVGFIGGIGFTISIFVADLAFGTGPIADTARFGILLGSVIAGAAGYLILRATLPPPPADSEAG